VGRLPNVTVLDERDVVDLTADAWRRRVTGVRVRQRADDAEETVHSDLVVDATGRGSRAPIWLTSLGYAPPREQQLTIDLLYATQRLRMRPAALDAKVVGIGAQPTRPYGLVLLAQGHDEWLLTAFGYQGHHPPRDPEGLLDMVKTMAPPDVFAAIRDAEPVGENATHRFAGNRWRRYDRLRRVPPGLLVFGDALCSTNPAYALGMSCGDRDLARRFFSRAAGPVNRAWQAAVGADLALPQVQGHRSLPVRVIGRYSAWVLRAAERDPVTAARLLRVAGLQDPASRLLRPATVLRALRHARRARPIRAASLTPSTRL
jgi:hypothetical protein